MFEHFTAAARAGVTTYAPTEARMRGDRRVGTEHLLLAVLHDADTARAVGTDLESVRSALAALDQAALVAVGVDTTGVERMPVPGSAKRTPFTSGAKAALARGLVEARQARDRRISPAHLMLALLDGDRTDPASAVVAQLGIDRTAVRARLGRPA